MGLGQEGQPNYQERLGPMAVLGGVALAIWKLGFTDARDIHGRREKSWRGMNVDADLKDEWLERLNSIEGINIGGSCAGHPALPDLGLKEEEAFLTLEMAQRGQALGLAKKEFGDLAFYADWDPTMTYLPRKDRYRIDSENEALARQQGKMFLIEAGTHGIIIRSPHSYDELRGERFEEWWETLVYKVEEMGKEARKRAS